MESLRAAPASAADLTPSPWAALALDLPRYHGPMSDGRVEGFLDRLAALAPVELPVLTGLSDAAARLAALDVLMVEAFVRRHDPALDSAVAATLESAVQAVAARMGTLPILSYPFYVRANPTPLAEMRRFTPTEAEYRFIRMHRLIEEAFDRIIERLETVLSAGDRRAALADAFDGLADDLRLAGRVMAGLRSQARLPREVFTDGFRPYFDSRRDPASGEVVYAGPSGLQSPTYRLIAMLVGYRDELLDGWTERIAPYHEPSTRQRLQCARSARDAGRSLAGIADDVLGAGPAWPRLHPAYGAHIPRLVELARRRGCLSADVPAVLRAHAITLGVWPAGAPQSDGLPGTRGQVELDEPARADLARLAEIEAMLFAFHLEHVATTAVQIGHVAGTGGTSGVEFLLLATFRRAFPGIWDVGV
jgi:tryptophan 2,3-dioxygenase